MKNPIILFLALCLLLASACKKDSTTPKTTTPTSPYYFKFSLDGSSYELNADIPQYMPFYTNEIGGYEVANANLFPSAGLRLSWPFGDTVKESDVMGLIGKTLYFSDTLIHPEISFASDVTANSWLSTDTANTNYNVKITNVVFLKKDTVGYPLKTYVITGTCNAVMAQGVKTSVFSNGSFNYIISRVDL